MIFCEFQKLGSVASKNCSLLPRSPGGVGNKISETLRGGILGGYILFNLREDLTVAERQETPVAHC